MNQRIRGATALLLALPCLAGCVYLDAGIGASVPVNSGPVSKILPDFPFSAGFSAEFPDRSTIEGHKVRLALGVLGQAGGYPLEDGGGVNYLSMATLRTDVTFKVLDDDKLLRGTAAVSGPSLVNHDPRGALDSQENPDAGAWDFFLGATLEQASDEHGLFVSVGPHLTRVSGGGVPAATLIGLQLRLGVEGDISEVLKK